MALGHLDELQKAENYPSRWSLQTGFTVFNKIEKNVRKYLHFLEWSEQHNPSCIVEILEEEYHIRSRFSSMAVSGLSQWDNTFHTMLSMHMMYSIMSLFLIVRFFRRKKGRLDTKMPDSTQKIHGSTHKNVRFDWQIPYPACNSCHYHYQTSTPFLWEGEW